MRYQITLKELGRKEVIDCYDSAKEASDSLKSDKVIGRLGKDVTEVCDVEAVEEPDCENCRMKLEGICDGLII